MVQSPSPNMSIAEEQPKPYEWMTYALRAMKAEDVSVVGEIDREAFPTTWPPTPLLRELKNSIARYLVAYDQREKGEISLTQSFASPEVPEPLLWRLARGLLWRLKTNCPVRVPYKTLLGFVGIWFLSDEAHITSIATRTNFRGQGIGELLLIGAIELALERGSQSITLEVRVSNMVAQSLYEKYNFVETGIRKRYYVDNHEDARIMAIDSIHTTSYNSHFRGLVKAHQLRWGYTTRDLN